VLHNCGNTQSCQRYSFGTKDTYFLWADYTVRFCLRPTAKQSVEGFGITFHCRMRQTVCRTLETQPRAQVQLRYIIIIHTNAMKNESIMLTDADIFSLDYRSSNRSTVAAGEARTDCMNSKQVCRMTKNVLSCSSGVL
jgi:hypothetical protein